MIVAVTYENGQIFQHFGHTENMKVYKIEEKQIVSSQVVSTNGSGHGALAQFLHELSVDVLICGGIGGGAQIALADAGIQLYAGISGEADEAVNMFIEGKLDHNENPTCNHHHEGEHDCGSHCSSNESHECRHGECI